MGTMLHRLAKWADEDPSAIAQRYKKNGQWQDITTREFCDRVYWLALYLESKGLTANHTGVILAYNSPQWVHVDLATLLLGARSAGIYPNSSSKDIHYILDHTETEFLSLGNIEYFKKITEGDNQVPDRVKCVIALDDDTSYVESAVSYSQACEEGKKIATSGGAKTLKDFLDALDENAPAFMIYTSGTTGNPKGALLSQDNLSCTIDLALKVWGLPIGGGSLFSFLPLCHIAEKIQNLGGGITLRYTVNFCSAFENVSKELPEVEPTLLLCVPRLWEKMMEGVMAKLGQAKGAKKKLAYWALDVGTRVSVAKYSGQPAGLGLQLQLKLADKVILSKIRKALGLGKAQQLASGAAALAPHVIRWFRSLGLEIAEAFGQTESTGIICLTLPDIDCAGTVGRPVPGHEFKIADDGEILTKGKHVFKGYFKDPENTKQVLSEDGWLHTGDLAEWTDKGLVRIRGRKKEILKTSGGKMIAPLPIEETLKEDPSVSQVCMVGDGKKYLCALITLSESRLEEVKNDLSKIDGEVITDDAVRREIQSAIDKVNHSLASYEQIKQFTILAREFSIPHGEMTPTLKMKRNVIEDHFRGLIDKMYE